MSVVPGPGDAADCVKGRPEPGLRIDQPVGYLWPLVSCATSRYGEVTMMRAALRPSIGSQSAGSPSADSNGTRLA